MVYNKKKYLKELETNPYWEVEPHFHYWALMNTFNYFRTGIGNKLSAEEFMSALYGEFDKKGKPILDGFIQNLNSMVKWLGEILDKTPSKKESKR